MESKDLSKIIVLFLFFVLIGGLIIIFQEEIRKSEFVGRIHTTAVAPTVISPTGTTTTSTRETGGGVSSSFSSVFSSNRGISFGGGNVYNSNLERVRNVVRGEVLHTITSGIGDYQARGFINEALDKYNVSDYAGDFVLLDRVSAIKETRPDREYLVILASNNIRNSVDITDWKVFGRNKKTSYRIPKATEIYELSSSKRSNVEVEGGDLVILSSGRSPLNNSFKLNKCSGYQQQFKQFNPSIKTNCPKPLVELERDNTVPFTDDICYIEVSSIKQCETVTQTPSGVSRECRRFLENVLNDEGCAKAHREDEDFFLGEWRLFLNSSRELWEDELNIIYLVDESNQLVATLLYK